MDKFQSGFRSKYSTETALLKVHNDLMLAADSGKGAILILLDLTAAFDTIDHDILLNRLSQWVGIRGNALKWFCSYLKDRSSVVQLGNYVSDSAAYFCGVPQGSILGPILFSLYMLPLGFICRKYNVAYHLYADDAQLYLPLNAGDCDELGGLMTCYHEIKSWMAQNFLQLNEAKTECLIFGSIIPSSHMLTGLVSTASNLHRQVRNLGVVFDSELKFNKQVNSVVKAGFFQLRNIAKIKHFLSFDDLKHVIHALILSRLDYCNSLYLGIPAVLLNRLQLLQNATTRLLTGTKKQVSVSPVLASLHWLPVHFRVQFKVLLYVFKALHGLAPEYISDMIQVYTTTRPLRSSQKFLLKVPKSRLKSKGDRAFSVAAPRLWNDLPLEI